MARDGLRAVVVGAGWAGEGHTLALRACGVDVVALCARRPDVVRAAADRLGVAEASTNWARTLAAAAPDIVSVATPAGLRRAVVEAAVARGAHLFCDKPLATTAAEAEALYRLVDAAGVKHAYGATHRYDPSVAWLAELVRSGKIGALREGLMTLRFALPPLLPWSWVMTLAEGGGVLNNVAPHLFGILAAVTGGDLAAAAGEARATLDRAPVVPDLHDFRAWLAAARALTPEAAAGLEWRPCDGDGAFATLLRFRTAAGDVPMTLIGGPGPHAPGETNRLRLYGAAGALIADGQFSFQVTFLAGPGAPPEPLPVPQRLVDELPAVADPVQKKWSALARDFVADVRGEPHPPYLTFRDGWRYQVAIDAIRAGRGWSELPA